MWWLAVPIHPRRQQFCQMIDLAPPRAHCHGNNIINKRILRPRADRPRLICASVFFPIHLRSSLPHTISRQLSSRSRISLWKVHYSKIDEIIQKHPSGRGSANPARYPTLRRLHYYILLLFYQKSLFCDAQCCVTFSSMKPAMSRLFGRTYGPTNLEAPHAENLISIFFCFWAEFCDFSLKTR